jgi:hypothetical protein
MSIFSPTQRPAALKQVRASVPWKTVVALAAVLAYADGFWLMSLRGAVGAIERAQSPFASWLIESTVVLPVFVFAVLAVLTLARHWFGPVGKPRTVVATALLIVAAGTFVGLLATVASSAYDYYLQSAQLQLAGSMRATCTTGNCVAQELHATLALHVRAVIYLSRWILLTNLVLVAWMVAIWGGRLKLSTTNETNQQPDSTTVTQPVTGSSRVNDLRRLLIGSLVATAVIHAALVPAHFAESIGVFLIFFTIWELAVAYLLLARVEEHTVLLAAAAISIGTPAVWLYFITTGVPFGPDAGLPGGVGLPECLAVALAVVSLLSSLLLLSGSRWLARRSPASADVRALVLVALLAVIAVGVASAGLSWFDAFGISGSQPVTDMTNMTGVMDMPH